MCGLSAFRLSSAAPLTFADDEATLVSRHSVGHLLGAAGAPAPVAAAAASAPGRRQASEAVFSWKKAELKWCFPAASSTSFPSLGRRLERQDTVKATRQDPSTSPTFQILDVLL